MDESPAKQSLHNRISGAFRNGSRLLKRWSLGKKAKNQIESWQELDATGSSLQELMSHPGWAVVEKVCGYYKRKNELAMRIPELPESQRLRAAIEWNIIETLLRDLRERVYQGQKAREALSKVQVKV